MIGLLACTSSSPTLFAAASTAAVLESQSLDADSSFAATSTLVHQVQAGAPAGVLLGADLEWTRQVEGLERLTLLENQVVLVGASEHSDAAEGCVAMGDPDYVPVGRYAKEALGARWTDLAPRALMAADARAALALVVSGQCPLGLVYATDAAGLHVLERFQTPTAHYELVLLDEEGRALFQDLQGLRGPFEDAGFTWAP